MNTQKCNTGKASDTLLKNFLESKHCLLIFFWRNVKQIYGGGREEKYGFLST